MPKILFTGGGTAGHVTPNIALIEAVTQLGWQCVYVGSKKGIERELITPLAIRYLGINSGKLRRYFSWQNFTDPIFILMGLVQSLWICLSHKPDVVFSKGGFVAVPVVVAAWICRIPVVCHESDITPGLANKLCLPFSQRLCVNFDQTLKYLKPSYADRVVVTGSPLRSSLKSADAKSGLSFLGFNAGKPVLLVVGGSLGAKVLNECIWQNLDWLTEQYQVVHIVGSGNAKSEFDQSHPQSRYRQLEYLDEHYGDVLACATIVLSRAGANSIFELLTFRKPHLLIPLSALASRGDQIVNARIMVEGGYSLSLSETELNRETLGRCLQQLETDHSFVEAMNGLPATNATQKIVQLLQQQIA